MSSSRGGVEIAGALDRLLQTGSLIGLDDKALLARFVERGDQRALEAIVERHGALVLSVCRQLLADPNDIDDAFQATFLVLIRKAGSIRSPGSVASWLYRVAYRTASRLKRKSPLIRRVTDQIEGFVSSPILEHEQISLLHQEINHLPEKYRQPIVLCYFEGLTHDDVAARLCWPVGTVRGRLARARDRLRDRLERRGVSLSAGLPAALDRLHSDTAILPQGLLASTTALFEQGVPLRISSLIQGVIFTMLINKLKWTILALTASSLLLIAAGTGLRAFAGQAEKKAAAEKVQEKPFAKKADKPEETNDQAVERLERHKVEAELLEITTQALKSELEQTLPTIKSIGGINDKQSEELMEKLKMRAEDAIKEYTEARLRLARLKRQIDRESKVLNLPPTETDPASLNRRLETLEAKVDQILQKLAKEHN